MTISEFFEVTGDNPAIVFAFFGFVIFSAILAGILGKGEGNESPWKYLYSALIYLVAIPGIFSVAFNIYLFLFERKSVLDTNIYTQILPILAMVATFFIIRANVSLDRIPGFGKLSGLLMMIFATMSFMWFLDKIRIFVFTFMPFQYLVIIFLVLFVVLYFGWRKIAKVEKA